MATYVPLPGSRRTLLPDSRPAGPVDRSQLASLTVRVRSAGDLAALEKRVYQLSAQPLAQRRRSLRIPQQKFLQLRRRKQLCKLGPQLLTSKFGSLQNAHPCLLLGADLLPGIT